MERDGIVGVAIGHRIRYAGGLGLASSTWVNDDPPSLPRNAVESEEKDQHLRIPEEGNIAHAKTRTAW